MKVSKKILAAVLAGFMTVPFLAGCSSSDDNGDNGGAAGTTAADNAGDNGSSSASVFKIGGIGPLTGDAASYGISVRQGAQVAVNEINEAGGVNGMKFELVFEDDECDDSRTQASSPS